MNRKYCERWLKSCLKKKVSITATTIIMFLMTGLVVNTPIFASVLIGNTDGAPITPNGSVVSSWGITIGGGITNAGSHSVHVGDASLEEGERNVIIGTHATAGVNGGSRQFIRQSVAIGGGASANEGARAFGDQSIAIGANTIAEGNSSIAIGNDDVDRTNTITTKYTNLKGEETTGTIGDAYNALTGKSLMDGGQYRDTKSKEAAVAIGVKALAGNISLALGTASSADVVNGVAIGTGATVTRDNAIAIGGGATTEKEGTKEVDVTVNGIHYTWKGGENTIAGDVVSFGKEGYERQLKHVAAGKVSKDSTDAINGSQLHGVLEHITSEPVYFYAGDNSSLDKITGTTAEAKNADALAKKIVARSMSNHRLNILGGATGDLSDNNIGVNYEDDSTLRVKLAKELKDLKSTKFKNDTGDVATITGNGLTITPNGNTDSNKNVSVTKDGLNNGGNVIANVGGNLDGAKKGTPVPTTNATVPNNVDGIKNNAATVGDVLQAGWNLQEKGVAKDFVKPYDTVNFVDGKGTTVVVNTEADSSTSTIKYDVNLGKGLQKVNTTNEITVKADEKSLTVGTDGVKAKTDNKTITTGDNGLEVVTGNIESVNSGTVKVKEDDTGKIATVDSVVNAVNNAAFTLKASAGDGTRNGNSTVNANGEAIKAGNTIEMIAGKNLDVKHDRNGKITFATVENPSFNTVQVGNSEGPKFSATTEGNISVSDKEGTNPVKVTNVKDGAVNENSKDAINGSQFHKLANNTIKLAGKNGSDAATETDVQNLNQQDGIKFTVKSSDGKLLEVTAGGDTITLTPKTGTITTTNGVPTANTTNGKLVTADQIVNALTEMGWKATADKDGTGTVEGNAEELIKAGNTVTFKAGDNLKIKQDGKNFIYSLNTALSGLTSAEFKDGDNKVKITPTGITITKPAGTTENTVTLNQDGLNNGGNLITNVASNLKTYDSGNKNGLVDLSNTTTTPNSNVATVGDLRNMGWVVSSDKTTGDLTKAFSAQVKNANEVEFIGKNNAVVSATTDGNGKHTVTVDVTVPDVEKGTIETATGNDTGKVKSKAGDKNKFTTVDTVVNAINSAAWKATSGTEGSGAAAVGHAKSDAEIKAGDTVTFKAGDNLKIKQAGKEFTYSLNPELTNLSKVEVKDATGNSVVTTPTGTTITGKDATDPTKDITTVINAGGTTVTDKDGNTTKVDGNGITITSKNDTANPVKLTKDGFNNGGNKITNVTSGLEKITTGSAKDLVDLSKPTTGEPTVKDNTVATVGDLRNMGWVVSSDKTTGNLGTAYNDQVRNANEVKFVGKGTAIVSGKTDDKGVRTITVEVNDQVSTNNSVTPVVYTKADGTKVYPIKQSDGTTKFNTKPDGTGEEVDKGAVITSVNGPEGTTTPTTLKNIAGNLPKTHSDTKDLDGTTVVTPTTSQAKPDNIKNIVNNAATVGDVLNAGWNLKNNGEAIDFVKPYDTVNFVNGGNTTAVVTTDKDGTTSNVTYNVTGLPVTYTNEAGKPVSKVGDNYYVVNEKGEPVSEQGLPAVGKNAAGKLVDKDGNVIEPIDTTTKPLSTNLVNPNVATDKQTTTPTQLGNVANGAETYTAPEVNGQKVVQAKDGKWYNATDVVNGTAKENATPVTPVNPGKAGLVDFSNSNPTNVATVGDLMNMGWIVSSDKTTGNLGTAYNDQVRNANEVKFVGKGTAIVSGKTDDKGVRTITVEVNDQVSTNNSVTPVVYTKADGTKVYPIKQSDGTTKFNTKPDGTGEEVDKGAVITSVNGPEGTTTPTTLKNIAGNLPKTHSDTKDLDGTTVVTPTTSQAKPDNIKNIVNNAATVGDVLNAGWNLQNNGTEKDFVKPYDTVNFVDGMNTRAVVTTDENGKSSTIKVDVKDNLKNITSISNEGAKDENGNPIPENKVTKIALGTDANGNKTVDVGEAKITNVADGNVTDTSKDAVNGSQLKAVKDEAEKHTTLSVNGGDKDKAGNNSPVGNLVITETTNDKGGKHYDVKLADKVTFGTDDTKAVTVDGTTGKITAGKGENGIGIDGTKAEIKAGDGANAVTINGKEGKVTVGDNITLNNADKSATIGDVKVNGKDGHITGLENKDWTIGTTQPVSGRAATEDQLKKLEDGIVDKIDNLGWEATVGKEGTGKSESDAKNNKGTVRVDHTTNVHYQAGDNLIVKEEIIRAKDAAGKDTDKVSDAKYTYRLNDEITLHNVTVKPKDGKDGTGVSLNGKDGSIGINGKDGVSVSMTTEKGPKGLDEENKKPRMTYEFTKTNPDGTPVLDPKTNKPVTVKENLATMNDGLHFAGDNNVTTISKKLNEKLEIVGGADRDKLTKNNIGVNANAEGKLEVQLSKELKGMTSAEFTDPKTGDTVIMNQGGITISKTDKDGKSNNVSLTREGLNNGGNNITNVKGNLPQVNDGDKKAYDVNGNPIVDKNNTEAPITADKAADIVKNAGNNAATVGDVLNAGWNLQNNDKAKDFVKPYDTVNFVDGINTKVTVETSKDGTKSDVRVDVVGLPIAFADKDGNRLVQVKDKTTGNFVYYKMKDDGTASNEIVPNSEVTVTNVNPVDSKVNTVGTKGGAIISGIANGAKTFDAPKDKDGNTLIKANDGKWYLSNEVNPNGTVKEGAKVKNPVIGNVTKNNDPRKAGLINFGHSNSDTTNAATVGDLKNMGWVVSTSDTGYNDQVRNANVVDFKEGEGIKISGETLENGVRQIKVGIDKNVVATKQELAQVERLSSAGIAGVAAMANIPQINEAASNRYNIAVGVGYHKGEKALAVGISGVSDGGRVVYKASAAMDSQRQTTVGLGVGYQFGKRDIEPNELDRFRAQLDLVNTQKSSLAQKLKEETHKVVELNNKVEELEKQNKMLNEKMDLILKKLGGK